MNKLSFPTIFLAIIFMAVALRFLHLKQRPMHTDEAVHGIKFGQLLEEGVYQYDPVDYHGPTLNYLTLLPALLSGQKTITQVDEFTLRSVTAISGLLLILSLLWLKKILPGSELLLLAALIAVAPLLVFYSRYYIQEILLVSFNFTFLIALGRYSAGRKLSWLLLAAFFAGLTIATKETWLLFFGLQGLALIFTLLHRDKPAEVWNSFIKFFKPRHFFSTALLLIFIYLLFYSSFFTFPKGIWESIKAFSGYFQKAGNQAIHGQPWWYYGTVLIKGTEGFLPRADFLFLIGGFTGSMLVFRSKSNDQRHLFYRFIAYTTMLSLLLLSLFNYKTPWNVLMPYTGLIFLSAYAWYWLFSNVKFQVVLVLFIACLFHLGWQTWQDNFVHYANPENTLVYSHPMEEIFDISDRIHQVYEVWPEKDFYLQVIYPEHNYWPLPWYLRDLPNISWQAEVEFNAPSAPVIVSHLPNPDLTKKLYELPPPGQRLLYIPLFEEPQQLRPGAPVNVFVRKDFYEKLNP